MTVPTTEDVIYSNRRLTEEVRALQAALSNIMKSIGHNTSSIDAHGSRLNSTAEAVRVLESRAEHCRVDINRLDANAHGLGELSRGVANGLEKIDAMVERMDRFEANLRENSRVLTSRIDVADSSLYQLRQRIDSVNEMVQSHISGMATTTASRCDDLENAMHTLGIADRPEPQDDGYREKSPRCEPTQPLDLMTKHDAEIVALALRTAVLITSGSNPQDKYIRGQFARVLPMFERKESV